MEKREEEEVKAPKQEEQKNLSNNLHLSQASTNSESGTRRATQTMVFEFVRKMKIEKSQNNNDFFQSSSFNEFFDLDLDWESEERETQTEEFLTRQSSNVSLSRKGSLDPSNVALSYNGSIAAEAIKMMKNNSVEAVAKSYKHRIPVRTLFHWKANGYKKKDKSKGRVTKLSLLEDLVFEWFLWTRSRGSPISDKLVQSKSLRIAKKMQVNFF
jgi:hypothetical protein